MEKIILEVMVFGALIITIVAQYFTIKSLKAEIKYKQEESAELFKKRMSAENLGFDWRSKYVELQNEILDTDIFRKSIIKRIQEKGVIK